jgi:hypothetical protein
MTVDVDTSEQMVVLLQNCLKHMDVLEAAFIQHCYLAKPRTTLKVFADQQGLTLKELGLLRNRAMTRLKLELAARNVRSMGDLE